MRKVSIFVIPISNFISLFILCIFRDADIDTKSFMKWYTTAAFSIPLIFVLLSLIDGFNPPLPNLYLEQKFPSSKFSPY